MKYVVLFFLGIVMLACNNTNKSEKKNIESAVSIEDEISSIKEIPLEVYDFEGLENFLNKKDGRVYVINFWATWCAPCVKELPNFEKLNSYYREKNVEVVLVSLDFPHAYDAKLKPFIRNNKLQSKVVALDDADMNTWIPKVDKTWSGSIPATVIYRNDERKFFEKSFTFEELETEIEQFLN